MTPAGRRPLPGRGLDPGHADALAFAQIQQTNQIGLMSRDRAQRASPGARLGTMHEITQPLLQERCVVMPRYGRATVEEFLERDRVSLWSETGPWQTEGSRKNMLRRLGGFSCLARGSRLSAT